MQLRRYPWWIVGGIVSCCILSAPVGAQQISVDGTLSTTVTSPDGRNFTITDGNRVGGNLFHSFSEFSVPTGGEAFFDNALDVQNIIGRVTGGESNIDGLLRANGSANLFLLNPSGIIFGPNARLDIGGSFIGSSASSINFADGSEFSATNPQAAPLLTVSVPVGLQLGSNPGVIRVQGTGHNIAVLEAIFLPYIGAGSSSTGLLVQPEKTLALIGGDVALEGGTLTAGQGRIELGSVGSGGVSLSPTSSGWTLGYEGVHSFQDIRLSQRALVDASGSGGGDIQLVGRHVTLIDSSIALIQNQGFLPAGNISVKASESLEVGGTASNEILPSGITSENVGTGKVGDIGISTPRLIIQDGGAIFTRTISAGEGGNLTVNASESVQLTGFSIDSPLNRSTITAATFSSGSGGDITISTGRLAVLNGAYMVATTVGNGSGGDVTVNATDSVELNGYEPSLFSPSLVGSTTGNAGDAGSLTINTSRLAILDGAGVNASTFGSGAAGSVTINASESVKVSGTMSGVRNPSLVISSAYSVDEALQQLYRLPPVPSGASGDVTINTGRLSVTDGAQVSVRNDGSGNAGTISVNASSIVLNNLGGITAATASGVGGNIFLQAQNLQLDQNSAITATAGSTGNGGNITIDTGTLVALENSDISANATASFGGRVSINAQGIFGTQFREQLTLESDITASSSLGNDFSGVVEIKTPDVDTSNGLVSLPDQVIDPSEQITAGCVADNGNEFAITGRGGLPPNPSGTLSNETVLPDLGAAVVQSGRNNSGTAISTNLTSSSPDPIVEAQGWVVNANGQVILTAAPTVTLNVPWLTNVTCNEL